MMKSFSVLHCASLLTVIGVGIILFYPESEMHIVAIVLVSAVWIIAFLKAQSKINQHAVVVERVAELKNFSVELQSLVGKELALVQEDVIRIREIVGDSIGILQDSTHNINHNMHAQKKYFEECLNKLNDAEKSTKKSNVVNIGSDLNRLKKNDSININNMVEDYKVVGSNLASLASIDSFERKSRVDIDNMMLALQFEDIVSQISERVAQHVGDIRSTVDILSHLCESELSTTFESDINDMKSEYLLIKDKLQKVSSKNLAAHKNMDEGDIELF